MPLPALTALIKWFKLPFITYCYKIANVEDIARLPITFIHSYKNHLIIGVKYHICGT